MENNTIYNFEITAQDILQYWQKLFPEIKSRASFDEILTNVSNRNIESFLKDVKTYDISSISILIERMLQRDLSQYLKKNANEFFQYIPFYNFFVPIINYQIDEFILRLGKLNMIEDLEVFMDEIVKHVLDQLGEVAYRVLVLEVNVARMDGKLQGETSEERYTYFSTTLLKDQSFLRGMYTEYATLIQLLNKILENHLKYILEMIHHTLAELDSIQKKLNHGQAVGKIKSIKTGLGDTHRDGRAVATIYFSNAIQLMYKPRSLEMEAGFQRLLQWLEDQNIEALHNFKCIKLHFTENAGWMEFIAYQECESEEEAKKFYLRSGQILALLYSLNAVDFHYENLIAQGEYPVLVDLESMFHGKLKEPIKEANSAFVKGIKMVNNSVQSISLLPTSITKKFENKDVLIDIGGLSASEDQISPIQASYIEDKALDTIRVLKRESIIKTQLNNPAIKGKFLNSEGYIPQIQEGFERLYVWMMNHKEAVVEAVTHIFQEMKSRLIFRPTFFYVQLLKISSHPDFMREGYHREMLLHRIGIKALKEHAAIMKSELEDLSSWNVPFFTAAIEDTHIIDAKGRQHKNLLEQTPLSIVKEKLCQLSLEDLKRQRSLIEMAYLNKQSKEQDLTGIEFCKSVSIHYLQPEKWMKTATQIGEFILENSIHGVNDQGKRDLSWIGPSLEGTEENIWNANVLGFNLYNGNSGIALFLGYLGQILHRNDFKQAALEAMEPVMRYIEERDLEQPYLVGALNGYSGYFYTLHKLSGMYQQPELEHFIHKQIDCLSDLILGDRVYDVIGGVTGCLGVCTSLYHTLKEEHLRNKVLSIAKEGYHHLIQGGKESQTEICWIGNSKIAYSGFSHGNAGTVAYLQRLYNIWNAPEIQEYIQKALSFERRLYSEKYRNWYSAEDHLEISNGWCHGAPGILLSKTMLKESGYHDAVLSNEINIAIEATRAKGIGNNPTYCHGDLGSLAILQYTAKITKDTKLGNECIQTYQNLFDQVLSKKWHKADMRCTKSFSLMIGLAGFGYSMIKNYAPDVVPEFLWLE